MTEISAKVLAVLRSTDGPRISENVLFGQFSQKDIDAALDELQNAGLIDVETKYIHKIITLL